MKDNNARKVLFIVAIILVCISVGGTIAGVAGSYWFTTEGHYFGLLTNCRANINNIYDCETRDNILKFSNDGKWLKPLELENGSTYFDTVLIILIIALFFDLLTLVILIAGVLGSDETVWKGRLLAGIISAFISGCIVLVAVGYAENIYQSKFMTDLYDRGWALILAWVGTSAVVLAVIVLVFGYFFLSGYCQTNDENATSQDVWRVPQNNDRIRQYDNKGYERNEIDLKPKQHERYSNGVTAKPEKEKNRNSQYSSYSQSESKHGFSSIDSLQPKFIYEENKKNNRYKYSYNPELMEQQYRHHESPPSYRHSQYSPPRRHTSRRSRSPPRYRDSYSSSPERGYRRASPKRNYPRASERNRYEENSRASERTRYEENPRASERNRYRDNSRQQFHYRPSYDNDGYEIR